MTPEIQSTLEAPGIESPALRNHISCMAHVIQLALGAFMSSLGVNGWTKSWDAHERDQHFGETESIDIGKSQRRHEVGNARINKVSTMRPGLAKIIKKVLISWYVESPETDLRVAANACCVDHTDTWLSTLVHWLSKSQIANCSTTYYGFEDKWNSTLELLEWSYRLWAFSREWLNNPKYNDYLCLFTPQDEWTIVKYIMDVLWPVQYLTLWKSKWHKVTLHHIITVYNDMFNHMDGVMWALAKKKTQWMEDLYFTMMFAPQKLPKCYAEVTPTMGMLTI